MTALFRACRNTPEWRDMLTTCGRSEYKVIFGIHTFWGFLFLNISIIMNSLFGYSDFFRLLFWKTYLLLLCLWRNHGNVSFINHWLTKRERVQLNSMEMEGVPFASRVHASSAGSGTGMWGCVCGGCSGLDTHNHSTWTCKKKFAKTSNHNPPECLHLNYNLPR